MRRTKSIIVLIWCLFLVGCSEHAKIKQDVRLDRRSECTYEVATYLWAKPCWPAIGTIDKSFFVSGVRPENVETIKARQMADMQPYLEKLETAIERGRCPKP